MTDSRSNSPERAVVPTDTKRRSVDIRSCDLDDNCEAQSVIQMKLMVKRAKGEAVVFCVLLLLLLFITRNLIK